MDGSFPRKTKADLALFRVTEHKVVHLDASDGDAIEATRWRDELTGEGGEGMVVADHLYCDWGARPGAGRDEVPRPRALRIIYGPKFTGKENIERLRNRGLSAKRSLALRECALGIEGLQRFVERELLHWVHECAFAVLALESEPVDPRM